MRLADLVSAGYAQFDPVAAMDDVAAVCRHDRYQASTGIGDAAALVAERAEAAGLVDVTVLWFPADGARHWWTYRAPQSWTPLRARLRLGGTTIVCYPEQAYTLAAYSAATPPEGRPVRLLRWSAVRDGADPAGALVVVDTRAPLAAVAGSLRAGGAVAIAMDPLAHRTDRDGDQVGRLELAAGTGLAAFSVDAVRLAALVAAADTGATGTVEVRTDPSPVRMPVVTGHLPGTGRGAVDEILLTAHLCHPRPGANDNASGVAALLGAARVLATGELGAARHRAGGDQPGVRFCWGPEFVGLAAYLHDVVHAGRASVPMLALNVDMAGEDVRRCGGPLVIERGPDDLPSFLPALVERCAGLLPPASWSYSGAVGCDAWTWRSTPFAGGSDHALLADVPTRCPAVSLGHWPDRTNHSSADTLDTVDAAELRRTGAVITATVAALRGRADPRLAGDVADATAAWAAGHVLAALPGRRPPARPSSPEGSGPVLDAHDDAQAGRFLRHRASVAEGALRALGTAGADDGHVRAAIGWVTSIVEATGTRLTPIGPEPAAGRADRTVLARRWPGPANLRALAEAATPADRDWLDERLTADRGGNYARALALLGGLDGARNRRDAAWWAALAGELPVPVPFADRFFDLLCRAGWAAAPDHGGS